MAAAQPAMERRGAGGCADRGAVPEGGVRPLGARARPGGAGAEGCQGEARPLRSHPAQAKPSVRVHVPLLPYP